MALRFDCDNEHCPPLETRIDFSPSTALLPLRLLEVRGYSSNVGFLSAKLTVKKQNKNSKFWVNVGLSIV